MALFDSPPHAISLFTATSSRDAGGGTTTTYTLAQSAVPCSVNTASASTQELFAQQNIRVDVTVAFLASALTTALTRGMKLIASDTSQSLHVEGISTGRSYGSIPSLVYAHCSIIL
jgi:hypothetical protein